MRLNAGKKANFEEPEGRDDDNTVEYYNIIMSRCGRAAPALSLPTYVSAIVPN